MVQNWDQKKEGKREVTLKETSHAEKNQRETIGRGVGSVRNEKVGKKGKR